MCWHLILFGLVISFGVLVAFVIDVYVFTFCLVRFAGLVWVCCFWLFVIDLICLVLL